MSKLSKILFFAILDKSEQNTMCHGKAQNVPREGTQNVPQDGTKRLLNLCATGRHKMCRGSSAPNPQGRGEKPHRPGLVQASGDSSGDFQSA
jgi:hypothetical protein